MTTMIAPQDLEYLRGLYPELNIPPLHLQYERALLNLMRGNYTPAEAALSAGFASPTPFIEFVKSPVGVAIIEYVRQRDYRDTRVTRSILTDMLFETYYLSGSGAEKVMAIKELGKLHGLTQSGNTVQVSVTQQNGDGNSVTVTSKKLQQMSDEDLLQLAPGLAAALEPPVPVKLRSPEVDNASIVSEQ